MTMAAEGACLRGEGGGGERRKGFWTMNGREGTFSWVVASAGAFLNLLLFAD